MSNVLNKDFSLLNLGLTRWPNPFKHLCGEFLVVTLLSATQGLISQLKDAIPAMQKSIAELTEEVESISSSTMDGFNARSILSMQSQVPQVRILSLSMKLFSLFGCFISVICFSFVFLY